MADLAYPIGPVTTRGLGRVLGAAFLSAATTVAGVSPAQAHATLVSVSPEHGEEVVSLPRGVVLEFSEEVRGPATIEVTTVDGISLTSGQPAILLSTVTQPLVEATGVGTVDIAYQVGTMDGHLLEGRFVFYVRGPATGQAGIGEAPLRPAPSPAGNNAGSEAGGGPGGSGSPRDQRSKLLLLVIPGAFVLTAVGLRWRQRKG